MILSPAPVLNVSAFAMQQPAAVGAKLIPDGCAQPAHQQMWCAGRAHATGTGGGANLGSTCAARADGPTARSWATWRAAPSQQLLCSWRQPRAALLPSVASDVAEQTET